MGLTIVAGVTPGKGGEMVEGLPVFNTCSRGRSKSTLLTGRFYLYLLHLF